MTGDAHEADEVHEPDAQRMTLYDLRVTVARIEGRSVCGMAEGDHFDVVDSNEFRLPDGKHFCIYAIAAALPLLPAKQRELAPSDWMAQDAEIACPDPEERLIMRVERTRKVQLRTGDLT